MNVFLPHKQNNRFLNVRFFHKTYCISRGCTRNLTHVPLKLMEACALVLIGKADRLIIPLVKSPKPLTVVNEER